MTTTTAVMAMAITVAGSAGVYTGSVEFEERDVEENTCYAMLYIYIHGRCVHSNYYIYYASYLPQQMVL